MNMRKFLAREITVTHNGISKKYLMSVATVVYDENGEVVSVSVSPFEKEIPGVEYSDEPLVFIV